ncbi:MAG: ankyrin repeat domain-containing protein [Syntrophorhabdaceae bacterium]|nr:ankyrin repeat domain-containing protein [Syntrophorhabdaceae bacterium]MDD4197465.1 ankyrin repeat domain-containing protein [Syntrophorhabdaceae bacterium]
MKENTTAELARELYLAVKDNDIVRLKELFQDPVCTGLVRSDNKFLCTACSAGFVEVVRLLLEEGSEINSKNSFTWTPLHWACSSNKGRVEIVRSLIEAGCDVNAIDGDGQTPLHKACWLGRPDMVRLLLENGADPEAENHFGVTPLDLAINKATVDAAWGLMAQYKIAKGLNHEKVLEVIQELAPEAYFSKWVQTSPSPGKR